MNSFNLAFKLFKTNVKTYGYYIAVMTFAVAVYYNFIALKHNPQVMQTVDMRKYAEIAAQTTSVILLIILVFFIWYSSSFFLKQRKKEIGIYSLMGISNSKIGWVFAIESIFLGITALGVGLLFGILFSKLFIMALTKAAMLKVTVSFSISAGAIWEVILTFGVIFLALSVRNYINVARSRLIDLINDAKKEENIPRFKLIRGIAAVILIGWGYYLSKGSINSSVVVVILVISGTFLFFSSFLSLVMRFLINRKSFMYRGVRIVSISNVAFRLKENYRSLAMLAIMVAVTITAFGTSLSLRYYVNSTHDIQFPFSFSYLSADETINQKVSEVIKKSEHSLLLKERVSFLILESIKIEGTPAMASDIIAVRYSDFVRLTGELKIKNAEKLIENAKPSGNNVAYILQPNVIGSTFNTGKAFLLDGKDYTIKDSFRTPLLGDGMLTGNTPCIIVEDILYSDLKTKHSEYIFNGFVVSNAEKSERLTQELMKIIPEEWKFFAYVGEYLYKFAFIGLFFFLGTFMSLVFILATGSIMYFKLLSEGLADKGKYEMLGKVGMSREEIRRAVSMQVGISLILPLLLGILHSIFAIKALEKLMHYDLTWPTLVAIAIFVLVYGVFYSLTTKKFLSLVCLQIEG